ncbi:LacI family DNA-binding transcriptional regulator [Paenibacillus taihuensis]|nr:LacI family DNA-binding transcriptional regulator [Paenibacillus taihuensis]
MKATIYDVAREAGVSIAAVSQVINGKGKISEERRAAIVSVMEKLNYKPSVIAAALTGKKTYTLGLLVPDISNPFFAEIARAVEDQGSLHGYSIVICSTDNRDERGENYLSLLEQKSVDGIIIGTGMGGKDMLEKLLAKSVPIAAIAREMSGYDVETVVINDYEGGRLAARHLIELGHTRMAVLAESAKIPSSQERIRGFRDELAAAGLELPPEAVRASERDLVKDGKRNAAALLDSAERPTALFCCNDLLAIGALQGAKELGLRVPEDVSVVGFDNTILASVTDPALTTIAQPTDKLGQLAVDLILGKYEAEPPKQTGASKQRIVLEPALIVRQSTSQPAGRSN